MTETNLEILKAAVLELGPLADEMVFVGGATTNLFITDAAAFSTRPTEDIDSIVNTKTYAHYTKFEERLAKTGFRRDLREGSPICRWIKGSVVLDVMPVNGEFLGFNGKWFQAAMEDAVEHDLGDGQMLKTASPIYFLATKLEAFRDRGRSDFLASKDIEDIISVLNGREELVEEISNSPGQVRRYITSEFLQLLEDRDFIDSLPGHLNPDEERVNIVLRRIRLIADSL